jgi:hypothetical protein
VFGLLLPRQPAALPDMSAIVPVEKSAWALVGLGTLFDALGVLAAPTGADEWERAIRAGDAERGITNPVSGVGHVLVEAGEPDELPGA